MKPQILLKNPILGILTILCFGKAFGQIQTVTYYGAEDAHVRSSTPTQNYVGANPVLIHVPTASTDVYRYFVNFPISSALNGKIIKSAKIQLKFTSETGTNLNSAFVLNQVNTAWDESTITWNSASSIGTVGSSVTSSTLESTVWRTFDVTTLVQNIVNGTNANLGFRIRRNNETVATTVCSYKSGESAQADQPKLVIEYHDPVSITGTSITHTSNTGATDGSVAVTLSGGSGSLQYDWYDLSTYWTATPNLVATTTVPTINNLSAKCYGLKISSTVSQDILYYGFLVGVQCEPVSYTVYPGANFTDDVSLFQNSSTPGVGNSQLFEVGYNGSKDAVGLMRFRLWLDPAYTALKADLVLSGHSHVVSSSPTNDAAFYLNTQDWSENNTTYTNKPAINVLQVIDVPATTTTTQNQTISIASFWELWKANNLTNYGMRLQLDAYGSGVSSWQRYHSTDGSTVSKRPYILFQIDQASCDRTSYTAFRKELDAGYTSTFQGNLKIQFTEEYEQTAEKKVPLKLYDENHDLKAAIDYNGSAILGKPLLPALNYQSDNNSYILNLSTYSLVNGKFYLLELTKSTGEKEYIRFMYTN